MLKSPVTIEGLKGVGKVELELQQEQQVYVLIGINGVGKTKTLEALFQTLFFNNKTVVQLSSANKNENVLWQKHWVFSSLTSEQNRFTSGSMMVTHSLKQQPLVHTYPVVFLASQNRGFIQHQSSSAASIGTFDQRRSSYLEQQIAGIKDNFTSLNMNIGIEDWFVTIAQSSHPYLKQEDNRNIEIKVLLELLHKIDNRIDPEYLQISGDNRVFLKIDQQAKELSHLSTGFASILKMLQAIISGYGYFTNETRLPQVKGIVLIDEIESHLHLSWQAKIIPLLKQLFPNTTFYITTHSPIVLSQLNAGEAYRLQREEDGVVRTKSIVSPATASLIDVLKDAFDIDINRIKLDGTSPESQNDAKQQLLKLIKGKGSE
ncbi:AAA family ATPase [Rheinheimera soli]|uniref:ATP-binding protein involved in virulence n=1 Tax=Rheinheimera soli TaxID=443616 RepID=A0ABU1W4D1_9GAMM|nr:AAA family ATPase [Rheinheimera soli]MDR7122812.1 putative ATP-binding protein involved in virulence [Rheinheimera soli]